MVFDILPRLKAGEDVNNGVTYTPVAAGPWMRIATADGSGVDGVSVTRW